MVTTAAFWHWLWSVWRSNVGNVNRSVRKPNRQGAHQTLASYLSTIVWVEQVFVVERFGLKCHPHFFGVSSL